MKKLFIGIDVSKDVFDYCLTDQNHEVLSSKNVQQNDNAGINEFCKHITKFKEYQVWICMEHTGRYGALLCSEFTKRGLTFSVINPLEIKLSIGITRGKTDAIDAYRIASYGVTNQHKLEAFKLPSKELQKLKAIMSVRDLFVKIKVQLKNTLKSLLVLDQSLPMKDQIKTIQASIKKQEANILKQENQLRAIIKSNDDLNESFSKITQVIGVGPITAIKCIAETDNFVKFSNGRKFSCHCGLAPFEYRSGKSVRGKTRTSKISNKELKSILYKAASTAIQHDPQLKNYFNRKVNEGKHKLSVLNAVANKIVLRIFAVAYREEPFVKLSC
ncbi:IS110 family transposase [Carboxylicivirga sp. N1Y90]|uniref:IS110 family transposase n=1 Tax=Carboxylicivirga fragile TaxID=3417571 RepID=UPI003D337AC9|nr:IS110 family transposase [Marinilabiliaceae bacterium N1Y90]